MAGDIRVRRACRNKPRCFAPETPIATPDVPRPIGEVRRGDRVLAFDHRTGAWSPRAVADFHENIYDGPLFTIATESGTIRATIYHPFWVLDGLDLGERATPRELDEREDQGLALPGRWVNSHELRCGDLLIGRDGRPRRGGTTRSPRWACHPADRRPPRGASGLKGDPAVDPLPGPRRGVR